MNEDEDIWDEIDEEEDEDAEPYCYPCRGTGEGMYDGSRCSICKGKGY